MKKPTRKIAPLAALLLGGIVIYAFYGGRTHTSDNAPRIKVQRGNVVVRVAETGFLEPINAVEIKSEQAGEVKTLFVQAGDTVTPGQKLLALRLESNQAKRVAEARAVIEQERLNREEAQREDRRMRELFSKGFVARREMEEAAKQTENAKIKYELAKRQLLLTLGGNRTLYEQYLKRDPFLETSEFTIVSPVSGTVIEMNVASGEIVSSGISTVTNGTPLMRIADLSKMWVKTKVNEVDIGQIREGQPATIRLDAILNHTYRGKVVKISPQGEKVDNVVSYEVTLEIDNPDQRLKPAMTANIDIIVAVAKDVLYLPHLALIQREGKNVVRVPPAPGQEEAFTVVAVGIKNETDIVITNGLHEGEEVLLPKIEKKRS